MSIIVYEKPRQYKVCHHVEISTVLSKKQNDDYVISWRCARCDREFIPKDLA